MTAEKPQTANINARLIALIHIKKTAGKSLKHLMRCQFGVHHCDVKRWHRDDECLDANGLARIQRIYPGLRSIAGHSIRAYSNLRAAAPDLAYYTFVREPIKRCISEYQYSIQQGRSEPGSFAQWIAEPANRNVQVQSLAGVADLSAAMELARETVDFIGLMESFDESLALMPALLGTPVIRPRRARVNAAANNRIRDAVLADTDAMTAVRSANTLDDELYQYVTRELFPAARQRAGHHIVDLAPARGAFSTRFFANAVYRYGVYKPFVAAWRRVHRA